MKFPYKRLSDGFVRPIVLIEVKYGNKFVKYHALIDSGADFCLFHPQIADVLGININDGQREEVGGITHGEIQSYYKHDVEIVIGGWPYKTQVGFMPTLSRSGFGLLGQNGFFDLFKSIKFEFDKEVEIERK